MRCAKRVSFPGSLSLVTAKKAPPTSAFNYFCDGEPYRVLPPSRLGSETVAPPVLRNTQLEQLQQATALEPQAARLDQGHSARTAPLVGRGVRVGGPPLAPEPIPPPLVRHVFRAKLCL